MPHPADKLRAIKTFDELTFEYSPAEPGLRRTSLTTNASPSPCTRQFASWARSTR